MFSLLRNRFGIPGVISVVALVFAMLGGAYAANNSGGGKATASAKAKKGPRGPKGATGPAGPAGPAGPQGPAGAKGDTGAKGDNGANGAKGDKGDPGTAGTSGKSVTVTAASASQCVDVGGVIVKVEGAASGSEVCNGAPGAPGEKGEKGDPWSVGGTLPPGATETGAWAFNGTEAGEEIYTPISFAIPVAVPPNEEHVHIVPNGGGGTCEGFTTRPEAPPGELCVYTGSLSGTSGGEIWQPIPSTGAGRTGAVLRFTMTGPGHGTGSWAVTGCNPDPESDFPCPE